MEQPVSPQDVILGLVPGIHKLDVQNECSLRSSARLYSGPPVGVAFGSEHDCEGVEHSDSSLPVILGAALAEPEDPAVYKALFSAGFSLTQE